jgi:hypothetical protein
LSIARYKVPRPVSRPRECGCPSYLLQVVKELGP